MAIKLLVPAFGHPADTIVRDIGYNIESRLVSAGKADYDLTGGVAQTHPTVQEGVSADERRLIDSAIDSSLATGELLQEVGLTPEQIEAGAVRIPGLTFSGILIDADGDVINVGSGSGEFDPTLDLTVTGEWTFEPTGAGKDFNININNPAKSVYLSDRFQIQSYNPSPGNAPDILNFAWAGSNDNATGANSFAAFDASVVRLGHPGGSTVTLTDTATLAKTGGVGVEIQSADLKIDCTFSQVVNVADPVDPQDAATKASSEAAAAAAVTDTAIVAALGYVPYDEANPDNYITRADTFTSSLAGTVPASGGVATNFLNGAGAWSAPLAAGSTQQVQYNNGGAFAGSASFTFNNGTGQVAATSFSGSGAALTALNASNLASGTVPIARLGLSGTADATTVLAGDNTWKTPTVAWGNITGTISNQTDLKNIFTDFGSTMLSTGVTSKTDNIGLLAADDFTVRLKAVDKAIFSPLISAGLNNATRTFAQIDYPLSSISLPSDGLYVRFIGRKEDGSITVSSTSFQLDETTLQFGYMLIKRVSGVNSFLDGAAGPRNVQTLPDMSVNSLLDVTFNRIESDVGVAPNSGLTITNSEGSVQGNAINWGNANPHLRTVAAANPVSFITYTPATLTGTSLPAAGTAVQTTNYWNGTASVALSAPNRASVQRIFVTNRGMIGIQMGEAEYTSLTAASQNISVAPFTNILPDGTWVEICRFASRRGAANLNDVADAIFSTSAGAGGGGTVPGGSDTYVQYNASGAFGGNSSFTFNSATGAVTASSFIPSGSTIPANGFYLPAANTVGVAVNSANIASWNASGLGIGATASGVFKLDVATASGNITARVTSTDSTGDSSFVARNNSSVPAVMGIYGSTKTAFGAITAGSGYLFTDAPQWVISAPASGANILFATGTSNAERFRISSAGNMHPPAGSTGMTNGFFYIPSAAGVPSGVPTSVSGCVPMYYDSTNNQFYVYNGAWKKVALT